MNPRTLQVPKGQRMLADKKFWARLILALEDYLEYLAAEIECHSIRGKPGKGHAAVVRSAKRRMREAEALKVGLQIIVK